VHIHERSEHFIDNDVNRDYEVHFVHVPDLDGLDPKTLLTFPKVVIGILYQADSPAKTKGGLEAFSKGIPSRKSLRKTYSTAQQSSTHPITPSHFFPLMPDGTPDFQNWFHYEGSLTSFPFTEDVSWFVIKTEGHVDPKDSADLEAHADQDARELQPLNRRLVVRSF
jgi:carbonic anhydrase